MGILYSYRTVLFYLIQGRENERAEVRGEPRSCDCGRRTNGDLTFSARC